MFAFCCFRWSKRLQNPFVELLSPKNVLKTIYISHVRGLLHLLPLLIVPNPNPKSFRFSQLQFLCHLHFDSFEAVLKLTRHFENPRFLNTITQHVDLFAVTSGFYQRVFMTDCLCGWWKVTIWWIVPTDGSVWCRFVFSIMVESVNSSKYELLRSAWF